MVSRSLYRVLKQERCKEGSQMIIMNCPDLKQGLDEGEAAQQLDITL